MQKDTDKANKSTELIESFHKNKAIFLTNDPKWGNVAIVTASKAVDMERHIAKSQPLIFDLTPRSDDSNQIVKARYLYGKTNVVKKISDALDHHQKPAAPLDDRHTKQLLLAAFFSYDEEGLVRDDFAVTMKTYLPESLGIEEREFEIFTKAIARLSPIEQYSLFASTGQLIEKETYRTVARALEYEKAKTKVVILENVVSDSQLYAFLSYMSLNTENAYLSQLRIYSQLPSFTKLAQTLQIVRESYPEDAIELQQEQGILSLDGALATGRALVISAGLEQVDNLASALRQRVKIVNITETDPGDTILMAYLHKMDKMILQGGLVGLGFKMFLGKDGLTKLHATIKALDEVEDHWLKTGQIPDNFPPELVEQVRKLLGSSIKIIQAKLGVEVQLPEWVLAMVQKLSDEDKKAKS